MTEIRLKKNSKKYFYYPLIKCFFIDLIICLCFYLFLDDISLSLAIGIFGKLFLFSSILYKIPLILIFLNHTKFNNIKSYLSIKNENDIILLLNMHNQNIELPYDKVEKIESVLSFSKYDNRMSWLFWDDFHYYKITMSDNKYYFISCLICEDLFEYLPESKNIKTKYFYPIILKNHDI